MPGRAVAPRRRTARELAVCHEVSLRTIERDIAALQESGVPMHVDAGHTGGYAMDRRMSLPPLSFSPAEAVAVGVALRCMHGAPFDAAGAGAPAKIMSAMSDESAGAARNLADRIRLMEVVDSPPPAAHSVLVQPAVLRRRVIEMSYMDRFGEVSARAAADVRHRGLLPRGLVDETCARAVELGGKVLYPAQATPNQLVSAQMLDADGNRFVVFTPALR